MKIESFSIGDIVLINRKYSIKDIFVGLIGTVVSINQSSIGVDFKKEIKHIDDWTVTHKLGTVLDKDTGYWFSSENALYHIDCLSILRKADIKFEF